MKKTKLLLALVLASVCSIQTMWAERIAPTIEAKTIESGKSYDLYNVGYQNYAHWAGSYAKTGKNNIEPVLFTQKDNGNWTMYFIWSCKYFNGAQMSDNPAECEINEVEGGYTFSFNNHLLTATGEYTYMTTGGSGDNATWIPYDNEELWHYFAKKKLYDALESTSTAYPPLEEIYENENSTTEELNNAANGVTLSEKVKTAWSEYGVSIVSNWNYYSNGGYIWGRSKNGEKTSPCTAYVEVDEDATLMYEFYIGYNTPFGSSNERNNGDMRVYLDDEEVQYISVDEGFDNVHKYYINLEKGRHTIKWIGCNHGSTGYSCFTLRNIGVFKSPTISVNLKEAGSLGTEVLYNTDHIKNVRKLSISGPMNSEDWEKIMMMPNLLSLDLTEAEITEIPKEQLSKYEHNNLTYLHDVKLPRTLKIIGEKAFYKTDIRDITFPEGLTTIGTYAFAFSRVQEASIPESVTSIGTYAFYYDRALNAVEYPSSARIIPDYCFYECNHLFKCSVSSGITSIGNYAFYNCYGLGVNNASVITIPEGVTSIGNYAFYTCCNGFKNKIPLSVTNIGNCAFWNTRVDSLKLNEGISLGTQVFRYSSLKYAELPTTMYNEVEQLFANCSSLRDVVFKSPTVMIARKKNIFNGNTASNITIHVPDYLVNSYKQDSYWYNYNITGFDTEDIKQWNIKQTVNLGYDGRFKGKPNVNLDEWGAIKISGDTPMTIDALYTCRDWYVGIGWSTMILSSCDNISIEGQYRHRVYSPSKKWVFVCLPFDTKVSDIKSEASYAVRYYDGARRATNGSGGNWKNFSKEDTIPAGTGFILQTSRECSTWFYAVDNESKQKVFSSGEIITPLAANESEVVANKGWNLVGNPWLCYYNIHKLNFTGAITVWNGSGYSAYSIIDDDYAILPLQPFFVQCPDEISEISFPIDGRQLTSDIESQNGVKEWESQVPTRWLVDVELSGGEQSDKTRFVLNEQASFAYETTCDASKFFSMEETVPQIYTIEGGESLAINERPYGEGIVLLGFKVATDGQFTINAPRNQFEHIWLVDNMTGTEIDLATNNYTFSANAGTNEGRFELRFENGTATGISSLSQAGQTNKKAVYNLAGQRVSSPQKGFYIVNGKKVINK